MNWWVWPAVALIYGAPAGCITWLALVVVYELITGRHYGD